MTPQPLAAARVAARRGAARASRLAAACAGPHAVAAGPVNVVAAEHLRRADRGPDAGGRPRRMGRQDRRVLRAAGSASTLACGPTSRGAYNPTLHARRRGRRPPGAAPRLGGGASARRPPRSPSRRSPIRRRGVLIPIEPVPTGRRRRRPRRRRRRRPAPTVPRPRRSAGADGRAAGRAPRAARAAADRVPAGCVPRRAAGASRCGGASGRRSPARSSGPTVAGAGRAAVGHEPARRCSAPARSTLGWVTTNARGRFLYTPPAGPSRAVTFAFADSVAVRTASVAIRVVPRITLRFTRAGVDQRPRRGRAARARPSSSSSRRSARCGTRSRPRGSSAARRHVRRSAAQAARAASAS